MAALQIHVLGLQWPDLKSPRYRLDEVWPQLARADLEQAPLVLSEQDIRGYDWDHHEIWLSRPGMARIGLPENTALVNDPVGRAFVVMLEGQRLYGGLFYPYYGAAGIQFPVIYALGDPIEFLRIRPALGEAWAPERPYLAAQCQMIAASSLQAWLARNDLLCRIPEERRPQEFGR